MISTCKVTDLNVGEKIYRIRLNPEEISSPDSYDSPPIEKTVDFRFNEKGKPVFYGAFDIETCIHECRVIVYDEILLATFKANKKLTLIDLQNIDDGIIKSPLERPSVFIDIILNSTDYQFCQMLAERISERGYDGIKYESYYSNVIEESHFNILLFGYPLKEGKISLYSLNRIKLDKIEYKYTFGPIHDFKLSLDEEINEISRIFEETREPFFEKLLKILKNHKQKL